jgi:hypothetical protein
MSVQVLVGGLPCTGVVLISPTEIQCYTPAGTGTDVEVINSDGQSCDFLAAFTRSGLYKVEGYVKTSRGVALAGAQLSVTSQTTGLALVCYADASGNTPLGPILTADGFGCFKFYAAPDTYTLNVSDGNSVRSFPDQTVGVGITLSLFRRDYWLCDALGQSACGAKVFVLQQPANVLPPITPPRTLPVPWGGPNPQAQIYSDASGTPAQNPLIADGFGWVKAYAVPGLYTVVVMAGGKAVLILTDQQFY